jgi:hypothetical protein
MRAILLFTSGAKAPQIMGGFNAGLKACSTQPRASALALFVFLVLANHPHHTAAMDDLALVANFLYRCSDFHKFSFQFRVSSFG